MRNLIRRLFLLLFYFFAVYFDRDMDLMINTSSCKMTWNSDYEYPGTEEERIFNVTTEEGQEIKEHFAVCKIEFTSSIFIGPKVRVKFSGHRALSLISTHGNIEVNSPLNIIRTCGIVPLNVVVSSPSSVPKAIVNCCNHWLLRRSCSS